MSSQVGPVQALRQRAAAQAEAIRSLAGLFAQEAEHLGRKAQVETLRALRKRVSEEVTSLEMAELGAHKVFTRGKLMGAGTDFLLGSLLSASLGLGKRPLVVGLRCAQQALSERAPFGNVQVAVGPGGVPGDVSVVCLSKLARDSGHSESHVGGSIRAQGRVLMSSDAFFTLLGQLERLVLAGIRALPVTARELPPPPADAAGTTP